MRRCTRRSRRCWRSLPERREAEPIVLEWIAAEAAPTTLSTLAGAASAAITREPDGIPERVSAYRPHQSRAHGVADDVPREIDDVIVATQRAIVEGGRPDRLSRFTQRVDCPRRSLLDRLHRIGNGAFMHFNERVQMIGHQDPAENGIRSTRCRDDARGGASELEVGKYGGAEPRRRSHQINPSSCGKARPSKRAMPGSCLAIHAASVRRGASSFPSAIGVPSCHSTP